MKTSAILFMLWALLPLSANAAAPFRNAAEYNLNSGVGLKGYDPVAVFPEAGGRATMGRPEFALEYAGVTYMFASAANREMFTQNSAKYEPTYGGWCAYAMASGSKVDIQPALFTIHGDRAHFFVSARAKQNFNRDVAGHERRADGFWKQISGEDPRP